MSSNFTTLRNRKRNMQILKALLCLMNLAAFSIYVFLRIIFSDFEISITEDVFNLLQTLGIATAIATTLFAVYYLIQFTVKFKMSSNRVENTVTPPMYHAAKENLVLLPA